MESLLCRAAVCPSALSLEGCRVAHEHPAKAVRLDTATVDMLEVCPWKWYRLTVCNDPCVLCFKGGTRKYLGG